MRFQILAASLLAISILSEPPAQADLVTVDFSGEVTNTVAAYAVDTLYSGSFSYDPSVAPTMFDPPVFAWYPPTSFSLMIGSDTYVSATGLIQTHGSAGGFSYAASLLSGNGPLAGGIFKVNFFGSSDPTLAANDLPGSFPTDFVATQAGYTLASDAAGGLTLVGDDSNIGSLTSYNQVPVEPSSIVVARVTGVMPRRDDPPRESIHSPNFPRVLGDFRGFPGRACRRDLAQRRLEPHWWPAIVQSVPRATALDRSI